MTNLIDTQHYKLLNAGFKWKKTALAVNTQLATQARRPSPLRSIVLIMAHTNNALR